MEPLISVIVPVYKVEAYLRQCVDSICNQTYQNLEIILVDDGSPDRCGEICDFYAAQDNRIRVIHQDNKGSSAARNVGLDMASGQYIVFIDSDDWIARDLFETVMSLQPFQIVIYGCTTISEQGQVIDTIPACTYSRTISFCNDSNIVESLLMNSLLGYTCNKIYSTTIIGKTRFEEIPQREDLVFNIKIMRKISNITLSSTCGYYYLNRASSQLHQSYSGEIPSIDSAIERMTVIHPDLDIKINRRCANIILKTYMLDFISKYICNNSVPTKRQKQEYIKKMFAHPVVRSVIQYSPKDIALFQLFSICYKLNFPVLFYHIIIRRWSNA